MFVWIRGALGYAPELLGRVDLLAAGERIAYLGEPRDFSCLPGVEVLDASGALMLPGETVIGSILRKCQAIPQRSEVSPSAAVR